MKSDLCARENCFDRAAAFFTLEFSMHSRRKIMLDNDGCMDYHIIIKTRGHDTGIVSGGFLTSCDVLGFWG